MNENLQSYSAKGEVSNLIKRRTRFERIKIAFSKARLSAWFGMIVLSIYLFAAFFASTKTPAAISMLLIFDFAKALKSLNSLYSSVFFANLLSIIFVAL